MERALVIAVVNPSSAAELFPGGFRNPSSVFISGSDRTLLKWFAFAALAPYGSRVHWTEVRLPGEILDPLDPMTVRAIPQESVYVLLPQELGPDDAGARRAQAAVPTVLRPDEPRHSIEGLVEFIRMPLHAQKLISTTGRPDLPSILVTTNAHRLASVYSPERIAPLMRALLEGGTCQVALWADAPTTHISMFDVVLRVDGHGSAEWRSATVACERGISTGPLAAGKAHRLSEIPLIAQQLERHFPPRGAD